MREAAFHTALAALDRLDDERFGRPSTSEDSAPTPYERLTRLARSAAP